MNRYLAYSTAVAVWCIALSAFAASAVLDQSSPTGSAQTFVGAGGGDTPGDRAQTFVVGIEGVLTAIDVQVAQSSVGGTVLLDVRPTDASGRPLAGNESILASASNASVTEIPSFASFDVSAANLFVSPGDRLAIVLRSNSGRFSWYGQFSDPYAHGSAFFRNGFSSGFWSASLSPGVDLAFRTYVAPVPEPGGFLLMATVVARFTSNRGGRAHAVARR